jgi:ADP-ribosylglycohydrolase
MLLGAMRGNQDLYPKYLALGAREWSRSQQFRTGEKTFCWLSKEKRMCRRMCMDTRMLDALSREVLGTPEKPVFRSTSPTSLTAAIAAGICRDSARLDLESVAKLGASAVAYTHGEPEAYISGAYLAMITARLLQDSSTPMVELYLQTSEDILRMYGDDAKVVTDLVEQAISLTRDPELSPLASMSILGCSSAPECLAGAVYATVIHVANFDEAMIVSVNHSGRSAAVAAITGALLGARLGVDSLPEFYLESLECQDILTELADDLLQARQVMNLFDDGWDLKYTQGVPAH